MLTRRMLFALGPAALAQPASSVSEAREAFRAGRYPEAARRLVAAISTEDSAALRTELGHYQFRGGDLVAAEVTLRANLRRGDLTAAERALAQRTLGEVLLSFERRGDLAEALGLLKESEAALAHAGPVEEHAVALTLLGGVQQLSQDSAGAERSLQRARELPQPPVALARTLIRLAALRTAQRRAPEASELLKQAQSLFDANLPQGHPDRLQGLQRQATVLINSGNYAEGEKILNQVLDVKRRALGDSHPEIADLLNNLAVIRFQENCEDQAAGILTEVIRIRKAAYGEQNVKVARAQGLIALILQQADKHAESETQHKESLAKLEATYGAAAPELVGPLHNYAVLLEATGRQGEADKELTRCLEIIRKLPDQQHANLANVLQLFAIVRWKQGRMEEAISLFRDGEVLLERAIEPVLASGSQAQKRAFLATLRNRSNLIRSFHALGAAEDGSALEQALSNVLRRNGRVLDASFEESEGLRRSLDPEGRKLLEDLRKTRSERARLGMGYLQRDGRSREREEQAQARERELEASIARRSQSLRAFVEPLTPAAVSKALPAGSVLIELTSFQPYDPYQKRWRERFRPERYNAYLLFPVREPAWKPLGERSVIDKLAADFRAKLERNAPKEEIASVGNLLYRAVMAPLASLLEGRRQVILVPDGPLSAVPFAALSDDQGRYLIERHTLSYASSGREALRWNSDQPAPAKPALFADPDFGPEDQRSPFRVKPLPAAREEALGVAEILGDCDLYLGADATHARLKQLQSPSILHLATHGFYLGRDVEQVLDRDSRRVVVQIRQEPTPKPKPACARSAIAQAPDIDPMLRSVLLLAGANQAYRTPGQEGIVPALEIAGLPLEGVRLAVLSACDSGLGDIAVGEGIYGLRRSLVLAGVRSQVLTLWKVNDSSSRDLMLALYRRMASGEVVAEALCEAQREMARMASRSPFHWAPFIACGDPRLQPLKKL